MARDLYASDLGATDRALYQRNISLLQQKYEELYSLVNFPPLRLWKNKDTAQKYIDDLVAAYNSEVAKKVDYFLEEKYRPLREFQTRHSEHIKMAARFSSVTNKNIVAALDLYASENPGEMLDDEEYMREERTPW